MLTGDRTASVCHGPRAAYPEGDRVDGIIARRAAERPDAQALRLGDTVVGYGELVAAARTVASALGERGVGPGDVVAVRAPRTPRTVEVLLGTLMAGAAYVWLPADWPPRRRRALLRRAAAVLCVVGDHLGGAPGNGFEDARADAQSAGVPVAAVAELLDAAPSPPSPPSSRPALPSASPPVPATACCVFLTSGTTGEPKAVLAPHRGIVRTALDAAHVLPGPMVSLQAASPAWDVFALELWVPLMRGGTCVIHDGGHPTPASLRDHIRGGVNTLALPAALLNALVEDDPGALTGLRLLYTGGSRASARHLERCRESHPGLRVAHCYGPVENTVSSTAWIADGAVPDEVPIGSPVTNSSVYLLGPDRDVVPRGVPGQLAVAGDGLSLGYLGDPAETARRFPVLPLPGGPRRVYLTGDIARMDDRGRLVFLGRPDRQLKVRGLRIEAEEIERLVESVPGVAQAYALALPLDAAAQTQLAAFYTREPGGSARRAVEDAGSARAGTAAPDAVRRALAEWLPAPFLPDLLVPVGELPLTTNAKVDRRALAALAERVVGPGTPSEAGAGPTLLLVLECLAELLGRPAGSDEDVFHGGATSLVAIRLATRVGARLARRVDADVVLTARTPRAIAARLDATPPATPPAAPPDDAASGHTLPDSAVRATLTQGAFWAAARTGRHLDEDVVPMLYRLPRGADTDAATALLGAALEAVVRRHDALRSRFADGPRLPEVRILPADRVSGLLAALPSAASPGQAERDVLSWLRRPFDLTTGPPLRAALVPVADGRPLLALAAHHIVFDGWSAGLFLRDLEHAYAELAAGRAAFTEPAPSFYRAAADQRERFRADYPQAVWSWGRRIRGVRELPFPLGGRLPWSGPAAELPLKVTGELLERADRAAATVGATGLAVFHAAYVRLLRTCTGVRDPVVAVPAAGRFTEAAAAVVGGFAGMIPVRAPDCDTAAGLVRAAAGQLRAALRPPLVPMEAMLPELPPGCHRHPLLQAQLLPVELPPAVLRLGGEDAEYVHLPMPHTLPELTVELWLPPAEGGVLRYREDALAPADAAALADRLPRTVRVLCRELEQADDDTLSDPTHPPEEPR